jgi:hypothetical protein
MTWRRDGGLFEYIIGDDGWTGKTIASLITGSFFG